MIGKETSSSSNNVTCETLTESMVPSLPNEQKINLLMQFISENKKLRDNLKKERKVREMMEQKLMMVLNERSKSKN